jgi:hypothetical protein
VVIEEVQAGAADSGGRTPFRPDTPWVVAVAPWQHFPMGLLAQEQRLPPRFCWRSAIALKAADDDRAFASGDKRCSSP